jgi:hypothetical protein
MKAQTHPNLNTAMAGNQWSALCPGSLTSGKRAPKKYTDVKQVKVLNDANTCKMEDEMGSVNLNFSPAHWSTYKFTALENK